MALEDRCSPQSAPSPPGIPHSPQNSSTLTTSITTLTSAISTATATAAATVVVPSFVNDLKINTSSINEEMSLRVSPQNHHQQFNHHHHHQQQPQKQQQHNAQYKQKLIKQNYLKNHINSSKSIHIDIVDDNIDVDDNDADNNTNSNNKRNRDNDNADDEEEDDDDINIIDDNLNDSINQSEINFSITNILSESFGRTKLITKLTNNNGNLNINGSNDNKRDCLFRPYDIKSNKSPMEPIVRPAPFLPQSAYSNVRHMMNEPYDFSNKAHRKSTTTTTTTSAASLADNNANHQFYEQLGSPTSYPKLHEEILNSNRKYLHHHSQYTTVNKLTEVALSKIPPLGNLCKTVSQIGQNFPTILSTATTTTCATGSLSPKSDTSSITTTSTGNGTQLTNSNNNHNQINQLGRDSLSGIDSSDDTKSECGSSKDGDGQTMWPAWVFCTRYSDRPSSGPRYRRPKKPKDKTVVTPDDKRPRTAFSSEQLARLKREFNENRYLTERRRQQLSNELGLNEAQIKIWFQNKRAKIKKSTGQKNPLALQLMAQGLYNHSTVPLTKEEEELEMRMNGQL